jgi:hypothetical protein
VVKKFKADENLGSTQFGDVGPGTMHRLDQLFSAEPTPPAPACPDGPVNMEAEPLPPIPVPSVTKMKANDLFELVKKRQVPGGFIPPRPPLGATFPKIENFKPVIVKTGPVVSENCFKCVAEWELPTAKVEIVTATGDFSDEPKRSFPVQDQSVSGCPFEGGGTFKDVIKRIMPDAEPLILNSELEHWSDFVLTFLLIAGRYLSNVRRLTPERSHLQGADRAECINKVGEFLDATTTSSSRFPVPLNTSSYGELCGLAVTTVFSDSSGKRDEDPCRLPGGGCHFAQSVPPRDKKPIFPNIDSDINPFTCNAFFRKFDKTCQKPGPPFSSIMEDKEENIPPAQPWNTL